MGHWAKDCPMKSKGVSKEQVSMLTPQEELGEENHEEIWPIEDLWNTSPDKSKN